MFHYLTAYYRCCFVLLFIHFQITMANTAQNLLPDELISELYLKYKEAVSDDNSTSSARRLFKNDKRYEVHVRRLKEVNGFKVHNLMIREDEESDTNEFIYINNPVESKIPKAYLTLEEFKNALMMRAQAHKNVLYKDIASETNNVPNSNNAATKRASLNKLLSFLVSNQTIGNSKGTKKALLRKSDIEMKEMKMKKNITLNTETDLETITSPTDSSNANVLMNKTLLFHEVTNMTTSFNDPTTLLDQTSLEGNLSKVAEVTEKKTPKSLRVSEATGESNGSTSKSILKTLNVTKSFDTSEQLITEDYEPTTFSSVSSERNVSSTNIVNMKTSLNDQTSVQENSSKVSEGMIKKTPKRSKVSGVYKATKKLTTTTKRKRFTLGRPLVFMGGI